MSRQRHLQLPLDAHWFAARVRLTIGTSPNEVRSLRGITVLVQEQPGLCRKTRQAIAAAIRRSLERQPHIAWEIANAGGLFEAS